MTNASRLKRLCFDSGSSYFKPHGSEVVSPEELRDYFQRRGQRFTFHCAVVYDASNDRFLEFGRGEARAFLDTLSVADELVSHSGRYADFLVLEHECGQAAVEPLRHIRHHDLLDIFGLISVETLARELVPDYERSLRREYDGRMKAAQSASDPFIAEKLAGARFDVERIWAILQSRR
jgi:hypothetical protein